MSKPVYEWIGNWSAPTHGKYVILRNKKEMEPGDVIGLLDDFQDLIEQLKETGGTIQELSELTRGK